MVSAHTETSSPKIETPNAKSISLNHLIAYESFVDTILGACLRLKRLLRTEPHYEVYDAESLFDGNQKYEVRAYNLRRLSHKVRNYKIKNLKRASARSSCIGSLEQGGKKWLVFADAGADLVPEPFRDFGPLWCTKEEYDRAFPVLEPRKPYNSQKTEKEALQDGVVVESYEASFAKALEEELSKRLDANQALEVIDRLRERLVASFKSCHYDDKITPMSEKGKKPKSPEQAKRLRDRQRLSRLTKRMAKTALKSSANSDSMSQPFDMTSGSPTEAFLGNENDQVAANHTVDDQFQERFEKGVEREFRRVVERKFERDDVKDVEKDVEKDIKRGIERVVEKDVERDLERDFVRDAERDAERDGERDYERDVRRGYRRDVRRVSGRDLIRDIQRDVKRDTRWF